MVARGGQGPVVVVKSRKLIGGPDDPSHCYSNGATVCMGDDAIGDEQVMGTEVVYSTNFVSRHRS
jgi:hypothetical protein